MLYINMAGMRTCHNKIKGPYSGGVKPKRKEPENVQVRQAELDSDECQSFISIRHLVVEYTSLLYFPADVRE